MTHRLIDKYEFKPGDMLIDQITGQRGILISRHRMIGDMYNPSPLFVWKVSWFDSDTGTVPGIIDKASGGGGGGKTKGEITDKSKIKPSAGWSHYGGIK